MPSSTRGQSKNKKITLIATHENADFDGLGSMVAARRLYPGAIPIAPSSQEKGVREFMLSTAMDYFKLFQLKDIDPDQVERVVLVDTSQLSRIGPLAEIVKREGVEVHIYDHHPPSEDDIPAKLSVIRPVGAAVTILTHILKEKGICPTPEEATVMAIGLYEDTGSFTFRSTTKEDFEAAAYLIGCGANLNVIAELVSHRLTAEEVDLLNSLIHGANTHFIHDIPIVISKVSVEEYIRDFAALVNKFMEIENMPVVFTLVRMENRIFIVARSRLPEVNVAEILSAFDGGGHPTAASAVVKDLTLIEVEGRLLDILNKKVTPLKVAKDIMSYPVRSISQDTKIKEAEAILVHYDVNALPVMDDEKLVGIITRPVVDKAIFHGLKDLPVKRFMTTSFPILTPDAPLIEIKKAILQHKQRSVPVVENGKLVGIITRKDLLHYLLTSPSSFFGGLEAKRPRRKFITSLMYERLPRRIIDLLKKIGEISDSVGYSVYAIGGFIRDLLLRRRNLDIDIVVEGDAIIVAKKFGEALGARVHSHPKFGTAVVIFPDGFSIDIATARTEFYETPGALPIVETSSLKLDLYRRDFTINTLAVKLNPKEFGLLLDFFGAQQDIKQGIIRVLHNLSFVEDPTRILRAVRFEQRFGFKIEKHTLNLIYQAGRINLLENISGARIWHELKLIFEETNPSAILKRLHELNALKFLYPSIVWNDALEELFREIRAVFSWFDLLYLKRDYEKSLVYLLGLADGLNKKDLNLFLEKLDFSEGLRKGILEKRQLILEIYNKWRTAPDILPSEIYFTLKDIPTEYLLYLMAKMPKEKKEFISSYFVKLKDIKTILTGEDLKAMGFKPGPIFREILEGLLKAKLNGRVKTRVDEERFVFEKFWHRR